MTITAPGVYTLSDADYHADPISGGSLSASGAKVLLESPARFDYERTHPQPPRANFGFGHVAHTLVLGTGVEIAVIEAADYRSKAAQVERDAAREAGATPILRPEMDRALAMVEALARSPLTSELFQVGTGQAEASLFWRDEPTGITRRARLDWLPNVRFGAPTVILDYKTAENANPSHFGRVIANYGYHISAANYIDGVRAVRGDDDVRFLLVVQDKTPPHLPAVIEIDAEDVDLGRRLMERACEMFRDCTEAGVWPGYGTDVRTVKMPTWARREQEAHLWTEN